MTYLTFINKLRVELKDFAYPHKEVFDGDGNTKNFIVTHLPIKDGSYTAKIGGVTKTETTHYTLDRDTGQLTFVTAPGAGSDNVSLVYQSVKIRDEDYLEIINDAIDHFRWKFWKMAIDTSTLTTVKDQYEYDCSGITGILYIINAWYKASSGATVWQAIQSFTNWKYYPVLQKLYVDPTIDVSSLAMKLLYLKSITKGTATSATLDIPDEWLLPHKYYIYARYYERLIPEKIHDTSAITTQPSFTPAQAIFNIAEAYYKKAEDIANKLAPKLPPMPIKQVHQGVAI